MLMCCYSDRTVSAISYTDLIFPPLCASPTSVLFDILLFCYPFFFSFAVVSTLKDGMSLGFGKQTDMWKIRFWTV